ncbi:MAG: excinuclease ABC subunit UvrA [Verrucomicrobiales bacterium]|nr:excinuclease ABC subunit UvrA [Verrucomicrobiales bacterium]
MADKRTGKGTAGDSFIEIRGARQNNLKGIDLDLPVGKFIVVTGPSGSGKSSLAFQTLYAEGQRRYVETFSPYTRQFFDRMDKPQVDSIRGIPPAIAIEQQNAVKTTRSTVGTITEINDYLKLLFPRLAKGYDPVSGEEIAPDSPESILRKSIERFGSGKALLILFAIDAPAGTKVADFFAFLQQQGYLRVWLYGKPYRVDDPTGSATTGYDRKALPARVEIIQDRIDPARKTRFLEAVERALDLGKGVISIVDPESGERVSFSREWSSPETGTVLKPPTPGLFSFNHPVGACPVCKGFGRVIGIDLDKAIPDKSLSIAEGLVRAFQGDSYYECEEDLERCARRRGLSLVKPFDEMPAEDQRWILEGEGGDPEEAWQQGTWYGVRGFFDWLESRAYRMHVRVFLSRYRSYTLCKACKGTRLKPEALAFRIQDKTLPELWQLSIDDLAAFVSSIPVTDTDKTTTMLHREVANRLGYLKEVGLGYLNLDRHTRTLSGGETERVNLTTCLGASLTSTLFVLDEPTVGLHPRDVGKLIGVMRRLRDLGNTLVVVEHEEAVIRAADHLLDIGPGRGEGGGELVYAGPGAATTAEAAKSLKAHPDSLTLQYLSGEKSIAIPTTRRKSVRTLTVKRATQHNLKKIDVEFPLGLLCCVTGVSGSGKSTLVHSVLHGNLLEALGQPTGEVEIGSCKEIRGAGHLREVVMVDQAPLARTPRSTPIVYTGLFDTVRKLFAETPDGKSRGITPGFFSFNSGAGRCGRCMGNGFEKVEMQFLSDLYVTCPECEGKRYTPEALEITLQEKNIHEVLSMTVSEAIAWFTAMDGKPAASVVTGLSLLAEVGLGYLRLGQPLNTLSGGESQRLKLVGHLLAAPVKKRQDGKTSLLLFDEPTTGLHFDDTAMLLKMFDRLVEAGDSVIVIEHNLDVIAAADHVIDLGPEAGVGGGEVVVCGTPEEVVACPESRTGWYLRERLGQRSEVGGQKSAGNASASLKVAEAVTAYQPLISDLRSPTSETANAISLHGARENNLKNLSLTIPREQFVVVTGLSGSGKSTLAFDILFAEGQRRFLDSMSTYARQFVEQMERPDIDLISGLPPTVAIEQRISRGGGKSTVATVTEVWHFLRLLYAKLGRQYSPDTGNAVEKQTASAIVTRLRTEAAKKGRTVRVMAPLVRARKGYHTEVAEWAGKHGYTTLLVDGALLAVADFKPLERFREHSIDVVIGEVAAKAPAADILEMVETALRLGKNTLRFFDAENRVHVMNTEMVDPETGRSFEDLDPRLFSYNSPHGWCPACRGYGRVEKRPTALDERDAESVLDAELREELRRSRSDESETEPCQVCDGTRLNEVARHVRIGDLAITDLARLPVIEAAKAVAAFRFDDHGKLIARDILPEISQRLRFLEEVGLGYLQLDRSATTLSGGESQRIRLAAQLGSNLRGVLYVLDEPTIGLHPRDNAALLDTLVGLREKGNSLVVVEHDEDTIRRADHLIDLGPGAGQHGGEVVWQGDPKTLFSGEVGGRRSEIGLESPTKEAFAHPLVHPLRGSRRKLPTKKSAEDWLVVKGARANNLKNLEVRVPIGRLTVITGISGSGKSSFLRGVLKPAVSDALAAAKSGRKPTTKAKGRAKAAPTRPWDSIEGVDRIEAVYEVDQSPIGKTSRSTPATYVKVFDEIRALFAQLPEARARGYTASRFSFNTEGGRCEPCKGNGSIKLEMNFLPTTYVVCEECGGRRYAASTLEVEYNGKSIGDIMDLTIAEAAEFFAGVPKIARTLGLMVETGLGYLHLGQPSPSLSGGEAQRIKLVTELTKGIGRASHARLRQNRAPKSNLYLIEEPSIGLHLADVKRLLEVMHRLVDEGHTVVVIEHSLEIMAEADYLIDIGPEAGDGGGEIVASGTPEEVVKVKKSRTAPFLAERLGKA